MCSQPPPGRRTRIPRSEPRPDAVALLGSTVTYLSETNSWSRRKDRPLTQEERDALAHATQDERTEAGEQLIRYWKYRREQIEALEALHDYLSPFLEQLVQKNLTNVIRDLTQDERDKVADLAGAIDDPVRPFTPYAF
ncbi:hypothetical protein QIS99_29045 [Streptomyces sp. B-S-A8]|uniref:Uncharacterized protein n=1 Tax=Streptomyces solicavernae TaxID=3043614 RepID=A0ABT6S0L0_9ACTN|nr:hypothetical protein [Streptomyces sp. B-S-A8]MDI3390208.1 hypothetical protein [Streptomyces sp. B-S-A8]